MRRLCRACSAQINEPNPRVLLCAECVRATSVAPAVHGRPAAVATDHPRRRAYEQPQANPTANRD